MDPLQTQIFGATTTLSKLELYPWMKIQINSILALCVLSLNPSLAVSRQACGKFLVLNAVFWTNYCCSKQNCCYSLAVVSCVPARALRSWAMFQRVCDSCQKEPRVESSLFWEHIRSPVIRGFNWNFDGLCRCNAESLPTLFQFCTMPDDEDIC